jgi:hypothetical protein
MFCFTTSQKQKIMLLRNADRMTTIVVNQWNEKYQLARRKGEAHRSAMEAAPTATEKAAHILNTMQLWL